jgi:hypothetical protein
MKLKILMFLSFFIVQKCDEKETKITTQSSANPLSIKSILLTQEDLVKLGFGIGMMNCYKLEVSNNSDVGLFIPCYKNSNGRVDYNPARIRYFKLGEEGSQFAPSGIPNIFWIPIPAKKQIVVYSDFFYRTEADSLSIDFDYLQDTLNLLNVRSISLGAKIPAGTRSF